VLECAARSVPDPDLEEEIKVYVVLGDDAELTPEELASFLDGRLASFKIPRFVEFRASLPHTPSERVAKHQLERDADSWRENTFDLKAGTARSS
jgi:crotonobetaine/carnitine-CoA ligase